MHGRVLLKAWDGPDDPRSNLALAVIYLAVPCASHRYIGGYCEHANQVGGPLDGEYALRALARMPGAPSLMEAVRIARELVDQECESIFKF